MSTPALRVRPWNLHVCDVPLPSILRLFFCLVFFAKNVGSLKTQISQKYTKTQICDEKNKRTKTPHSLKARQGHTKYVCKISGSNSKKRRGHWHLNEFGVLRLNQPVYRICSMIVYSSFLQKEEGSRRKKGPVRKKDGSSACNIRTTSPRRLLSFMSWVRLSAWSFSLSCVTNLSRVPILAWVGTIRREWTKEESA